MVNKIQILPEAIAQKIAAGEVVERPASVIKELMENAIDAGATEIVVELQAGGLQLIRVIDNGEGMVREDVPLALQRFATSKIRQAEDLFTIETLGFRGEALPSIASVSKMIIKTRPSSSMVGTKVLCEGGHLQSISEVGCPVGTEVEVHQLFYNFPVRRKFLRSVRAELRFGLIQFHRLSLAYPSITFKFIHEGRLLEELLKTESDWVRMEAIWGRETTDHLRPIRSEEGELLLEGFISNPSLAKGNREGISIYINGRYVKDRIISKAVWEAYRHVLPAEKFPVVLLRLRLPPTSVDVNVHPTKAEVKFREPERLYQFVLSSLRRTLAEGTHPKGGVTGEPMGALSPQRGRQDTFSFRRSQGLEDVSWIQEWNRLEVREGPGVEWESTRRESCRIVGQLWGTYLLCEAGETLIFIDQHAAHERILFERFKKDYEERSITAQPLLIPILLELSLEESLLLDSARESFASIGFEVEAVGEKLYAIRSIPSFVEPKEAGERVKEMLEELSFLKKGGEGTAARETLLISLACHTAIRAHHPLKREEVEALIAELYPFNPSATCPHGRPIFSFLPLDEMNRKFKRD